MPKIIVPQAAIWMEFELETGLISPPKIKLKLKLISSKESVRAYTEDGSGVVEGGAKNFMDIYETGADLVMKNIVGWDLEDEKGKIPCNDKTKKKWLDELLWEKPLNAEQIIGAEDSGKTPRGRRLFWAMLLDIMVDTSRFVKN